jgi:hypothetical protein
MEEDAAGSRRSASAPLSVDECAPLSIAACALFSRRSEPPHQHPGQPRGKNAACNRARGPGSRRCGQRVSRIIRRPPPAAAGHCGMLSLECMPASGSGHWHGAATGHRNGCSASRRGLRVTICPSRAVAIGFGPVAMIGTSRLGDITAGISDACR